MSICEGTGLVDVPTKHDKDSKDGQRLTNSLMGKVLLEYGFRPDEKQCEQIRTYVALLQKWNRQISLTRVTDAIDILKFHFGESFYAITTTSVGSGRLADVGSGAGFPGMALAIANPQLSAILIEANLKKAVFLSEVKRELQLGNVEIFRGRMDDYRGSSLDLVVCRAVGQFGDFLAFAKRLLVPTGRVILWVGLEDCRKIVMEYANWDWSEAQLIPHSERRFILVGSNRPE